MSPRGGTATRPSTTATLRCGSQCAASRCPVELQRRRADDDRRVGVVGLERGERLDGLAEPLLVGEERAARVEHVAHAGPLERLELAAEHGGDLRRSARRSVARERRIAVAGLAVLGAQRARAPAPRAPSTSTSCSARKASSGSTQPRVERRSRAARLGAGQRVERLAGVGIPQHLEPQALAVDAARRGQPRGRRRRRPSSSALHAALARRRRAARSAARAATCGVRRAVSGAEQRAVVAARPRPRAAPRAPRRRASASTHQPRPS